MNHPNAEKKCCNKKKKKNKLAFLSEKKALRIFYFVFGFFALAWYLIRVIPKPSRATYPCMQATAPFASGFLMYLGGLAISVLSYKKAITKLKTQKYASFLILLVIAIGGFIFAFSQNSEVTYAKRVTKVFDANQPIGVAQGIIPGRVTWAHDPDATNENASASNWLNNTVLNKVEIMINNSITSLTGEQDRIEGWNKLFEYFNFKKGKGEIGYQDGEKIFIKINSMGTSSVDQNYNLKKLGQVRTSPEVVLVILRHLVNELKIPQENIAVGDPMHCVANPWYNLWYPEFPDVHYIDHRGEKGRTKAVPGTDKDIFYSDRGSILRTGGPGWFDPSDGGDPIYDDSYYTVIEDADYMINIACLKGHHRAGITLTAKNHFGSHTRETAIHLHMGLVIPDGLDDRPIRAGYGLYRIQVDLMANKYLGGNTMLFVVDALYGGPDAGTDPVKFKMPPFNNDWTSSIFMSQDQVALESVGFDFLQTEFRAENGHSRLHPQMDGTDDYLRQAADSSNWPEGMIYDPDNTGKPISSLGVHEHWNNPVDKQYSRNLGMDKGIELYKVENTATSAAEDKNLISQKFQLMQNYPNPFNPTTKINFNIQVKTKVNISIYNSLGQFIQELVDEIKYPGAYSIEFDASDLSAGTYIYKMQTDNFKTSKKMILLK